MLPNFFIVGAQKSGTTSLHNYLSEHPDIYLPTQKETKFFVDPKKYAEGIKCYEEKYFSGHLFEKAVGEVDPDYLYFNEALPRIAKHIKYPKIIFIFRNPVERAFSHYLMTYRRGIETYTFEEAIAKEEERIKNSYYGNFHYSYISRGFYYRQLQRFIASWDTSNMLFLLTDDLLCDSKSVVHKCFDFLEVSKDFTPSTINSRFHEAKIPRTMEIYNLIRGHSLFHSTLRSVARSVIPKLEWRGGVRKKMIKWNQRPNKGRMKLKEESQHFLQDIYREENSKLSEILNRSLDHWNQLI